MLVSPRMRRLAVGIVFAASFIGLAFYFLEQPILADGDSYYHLGIARQFNQHGLLHDLPWARFSVMRDGFGDKELLFHAALSGITTLGEPHEMGRLALAFFNALLIALLAWLGMQALGWPGLLVPAFVYLGSYPFADRVSRLRPELMALSLMLLFIWLASRRRYVIVAIVCACFAVSYTAFHVLGLLSVLFTIADRKLDWKLPASTCGGLAAGVLLHPHFPHNVVVWWYQNVLFFLYKNKVDVGTEIRPPALRDTLLFHLPVVIALIVYWLSSRARDDEDARPARYFLVTAILFAILYVSMARMVTWLVPLMVLAVVFRPREIVHKRALGAGLAVLLIAALLQTFVIFRQGTGEWHLAEANYEALGRAIPNGAKVAADWRDGTVLVFFAPQGRYLNVLDPVFMAARYPREFAISESIWNGKAPDLAAALRALDSDYILFVPTRERRLLQQRLERDPRFTPVFTRGAILARLN